MASLSLFCNLFIRCACSLIVIYIFKSAAAVLSEYHMLKSRGLSAVREKELQKGCYFRLNEFFTVVGESSKFDRNIKWNFMKLMLQYTPDLIMHNGR